MTSFSSNDNPCKDCDKHGIDYTCHGKCKDYITWRNNRDEYLADIRKKKYGPNEARTFRSEMKEKIRRRYK